MLRLCLIATLVVVCLGAEQKPQGVELLEVSASQAEHDSLLAEIRQSHPLHVAHKHTFSIPDQLQDRANLLFRTLDEDRDRKLTAADVKAALHKVQARWPDITEHDMIAFIEAADTNHDHGLDREELLVGLSHGLEQQQQPMNTASLAETDSRLKTTDSRRRRVGALGDMWNAAKNFGKKVIQNVKNKVVGAAKSAAGMVDHSQDSCVLCQYYLERCEINLRAVGLTAGTFYPGMAHIELSAELKPHQKSSPRVSSFVELKNKVKATATYPVGIAIDANRLNSRYQREVERAKYNNIYRIIDLTLDDVCEQATPNSFYGYCKQVYATESDIVDGFRYQYRPTDICFRVGMCPMESYIARGIHSRYNAMASP